MRSERSGHHLMLALALLLLGPVWAGADSCTLEANDVTWSRLSYSASKLGVSMSADLELKPISGPVALAAAAGDADLAPEGQVPSRSLLLTLDSKIRYRESNLLLWMEEDASARWRMQNQRGLLRSGSRHRELRYEADGIRVVSKRPTRSEAGANPTTWSNVAKRFHPYPSQLDPKLVIAEPAGLFYFTLSSCLRREGGEIRLYTFSKGSLIEVNLRAHELREIDVKYTRHSQDGKKSIAQRALARRISIEGRAIDAQAGDSVFEVLGLQGEVELFLEPASGVPLMLTGKIPYFGRVAVRLTELVGKDSRTSPH